MEDGQIHTLIIALKLKRFVSISFFTTRLCILLNFISSAYHDIWYLLGAKICLLNKHISLFTDMSAQEDSLTLKTKYWTTNSVIICLAVIFLRKNEHTHTVLYSSASLLC